MILSKRAVELSANFLVITILSIAMLGFGIYFTKQIFTKSNDYTRQIDADTTLKMEELMNDGSKIVIPFQTKTAARGSTAVFGIGVLNMLGDPKNFKINTVDNSGADTLYAATAYAKDGTTLIDNSKVTLLYNPDAISIKNLDNNKWGLAANVDKTAPSGTYIINLKVQVEDDSNPGIYEDYADPVYKLYVNVP